MADCCTEEALDCSSLCFGGRGVSPWSVMGRTGPISSSAVNPPLRMMLSDGFTTVIIKRLRYMQEERQEREAQEPKTTSSRSSTSTPTTTSVLRPRTRCMGNGRRDLSLRTSANMRQESWTMMRPQHESRALSSRRMKENEGEGRFKSLWKPHNDICVSISEPPGIKEGLG